MKVKRSIGMVADLHGGCNYGLCPPGFKNDEGNEIRLNKGQKVLWDHYMYVRKQFGEEEIDSLVVDGDITQGQNIAERGVKCFTTDMDEQIKLSIFNLHPMLSIPTVKKAIFIQGSQYHVGMRGLQVERQVYRAINRDPAYPKAEWAGLFGNIKFVGTPHRMHIIHGKGITRLYRSQYLDKRNLYLNAAAGVGKLPYFSIQVRAHDHYFEYIEINGQHLIQIPCFCLLIPWQGIVENYARFQPDIGGVLLQIMEDDSIRVKAYILDSTKIPPMGHEMRFI